MLIDPNQPPGGETGNYLLAFGKQFRIILVAAVVFLVLSIWNGMFRYVLSSPLQNWQRANEELFVTRDDWDVPHNFTKQMLNATSITETLEILSNYLENKQVWCPEKRRFGHRKDGGKDICVARPFNLVHRQCTVYSFGIGRDFSFDDEIAETCEVFSYDPTIGLEDHKRGQHVHFFNTGIKGEKSRLSDKYRTKTVLEIFRENKHLHTTIDVFKIDVEGSEWEVIKDMHKSGVLSRIKQISMEVHIGKTNNYKERYQILQLLEKAGFKLFQSEPNLHCKVLSKANAMKEIRSCYEVNYINMNFLK
ncbi:unnamed protein product [Owenia fusiformis]|uniref:Methyltransferase domain-containing protein n=1 Tax=Owenia fusiformis TaxID=6347 RepID=A0A8S4N6P9_OWEFU|nr:unnamed protein product [Owenia fusiformis]